VPVTSGIDTKKIMITPWAVKIRGRAKQQAAAKKKVCHRSSCRGSSVRQATRVPTVRNASADDKRRRRLRRCNCCRTIYRRCAPAPLQTALITNVSAMRDGARRVQALGHMSTRFMVASGTAPGTAFAAAGHLISLHSFQGEQA
jgi:hypothetical protein